jgi:hypothetical protein
MRLIALALGLLPLTACTTSIEDIREGPPMQVGEFPRPYEALARCVFDRLDAESARGGSLISPSPSPFLTRLSDLLYHLENDPSQRRTRVSATLAGPPATAMFDITIESTADGAAHVEYRRWVRASRALDRATWEIVTACGQPG